MDSPPCFKELIDVDISDEYPTSNEGNFRELLKFKIRSGDSNLKNHMENTLFRAIYIGKKYSKWSFRLYWKYN